MTDFSPDLDAAASCVSMAASVVQSGVAALGASGGVDASQVLAYDVAHPDILGILGGYSNGEVPLGDLQDEIFLLFAFDGPGFDRLDQRSTVVWIDNGVSDLKNHLFRAPFDTPC